MIKAGFSGFTKEGVSFLRELKRNNNKEWFSTHKGLYENKLLAPARAFVTAMGERLKEYAPEVNADPRRDRSIFRIYRDTRFSKDKQPYKTHLGIFFWEGPLKKMECSGFYFHLEPPFLNLYTGLYIFSPPVLREYREAVSDPELGKELEDSIKKMITHGPYIFGGEHYKRVPRGYDPHHPRAELLRYNGLYAGIEGDIPNALFSDELIDFCSHRFQNMLPLHQWLVKLTKRI